jgi:hypothetical protein
MQPTLSHPGQRTRAERVKFVLRSGALGVKRGGGRQPAKTEGIRSIRLEFCSVGPSNCGATASTLSGVVSRAKSTNLILKKVDAEAFGCKAVDTILSWDVKHLVAQTQSHRQHHLHCSQLSQKLPTTDTCYTVIAVNLCLHRPHPSVVIIESLLSTGFAGRLAF